MPFSVCCICKRFFTEIIFFGRFCPTPNTCSSVPATHNERRERRRQCTTPAPLPTNVVLPLFPFAITADDADAPPLPDDADAAIFPICGYCRQERTLDAAAAARRLHRRFLLIPRIRIRFLLPISLSPLTNDATTLPPLDATRSPFLPICTATLEDEEDDSNKDNRKEGAMEVEKSVKPTSMPAMVDVSAHHGHFTPIRVRDGVRAPSRESGLRHGDHPSGRGGNAPARAAVDALEPLHSWSWSARVRGRGATSAARRGSDNIGDVRARDTPDAQAHAGMLGRGRARTSINLC